MCPGPVYPQVGEQCAQGGGQAGVRRHDHPAYPRRLGQRHGMQRAGATKGHQVEVAGINAPLDREQPQRVRHVLVRQLHDGQRGVVYFGAHPPAHGGDGRAGLVTVQGHRAGQEVVGIETPQNQVCVGHGRVGTAGVVARRARIGAGALWADLEKAALVHPGERAATGANGSDVNEGRRDRNAPFDLILRGVAVLAVND